MRDPERKPVLFGSDELIVTCDSISPRWLMAI
jgi:hypothetical protein